MKRKESLLVRDNIVKIVEEKLNLNLSLDWNDLYKINGGEVRRLKGMVYDLSKGKPSPKVYRNNDIKKIGEFINSLEFEGFEINFRKLNLMEESSYVILTIEWNN
jgi:hypothetical protein